MIHTDTTVRTLQAVAIIVGIAIFLWGTGLPTLFHAVEAAAITDASDVLSNSAPGQDSVHTITFTTPNGMAQGDIFLIQFASAFNETGLTVGDISVTVNGNSSSTAASAGANTFGVDIGTDVIEFTAGNGGVASSSTMVLTIGQDAGNMINNPSSTSTTYTINIGQGTSTAPDSGQVRVAIIDQVTVSANVNTSLTFSVTGLGLGAAVNGETTTGAASHVALPFGTLDVNSPEVLAQRLNVSTNAENGYTVTVEQTGELQSTTGATIDGFIDGSYTQTPTTWQSPDADVADPDTYGHWGLTSTDGTTTRAQEFGSNQWVSGSTTPIVIMGHDGPADGTTNGFGSTTVGYQIEISALQEAGDDYTTTLRYVATPTF